jgi:hypothetical protein
MDSASTQRTCSGSTDTATCNITCKGEFYDLDGNAANGCEAEDAPVQATAATAVTLMLPNVNNGGNGSMPCSGSTNPCTHTAQVFSDARIHEAAPVSRQQGREDWYKLVATGAGGPNQVGACLGITNYPADNQYELCIGNDGVMTPTTCLSVQGGAASVCVAPPTAADAGTFYIKVRKLAGSTTTTNKYALFVQH